MSFSKRYATSTLTPVQILNAIRAGDPEVDPLPRAVWLPMQDLRRVVHLENDAEPDSIRLWAANKAIRVGGPALRLLEAHRWLAMPPTGRRWVVRVTRARPQGMELLLRELGAHGVALAEFYETVVEPFEHARREGTSRWSPRIRRA